MIQNVSEYTFLGSLIKSNGNINHSLEDLAKKAQKVLFSIKSRVASLAWVTLHSPALTPIFEDVFLAPKVNLQKFK
jgi:hypothetical protein